MVHVSVCICAHVCAFACTRVHVFVSVVKQSVSPSLLYPADLAVAHLPQGLRQRRLVASCSTHSLANGHANRIKKAIGIHINTHVNDLSVAVLHPKKFVQQQMGTVIPPIVQL